MSKVLLITGGGRRIGAATARLAAERGFAICVNYRRNQAAAGVRHLGWHRATLTSAARRALVLAQAVGLGLKRPSLDAPTAIVGVVGDVPPVGEPVVGHQFQNLRPLSAVGTCDNRAHAAAGAGVTDQCLEH